jgi:hypothetical protein
MPTPIPIYAVVAPPGVMLRARLRNPDGSTNAEFALVEDGAGLGTYAATGSLTPVVDATGVAYTVEVREVSAQTSGAFDASAVVRAARQPVGWNGAVGNFISALGIPGVDVVLTNGEPLLPLTGGVGGGGSGDTAITHDGAVGTTVNGVPSYPDCMRVVATGGAPLDDVEIVAFRQEDWDAGRTSADDRQGWTRTDPDGRWVNPINLNPGEYVVNVQVRGYTAYAFALVVT